MFAQFHRLSFTDKWLLRSALPVLKDESLLANQAALLVPIEAISEFAPSISLQIERSTAFRTNWSRIFQASLDLANSSFKFKVLETVNTSSSFISHTAIINLGASAIFCEVIAAFTCGAAIVVQSLTVFNITVPLIGLEWRPALRTSMPSSLRPAA